MRLETPRNLDELAAHLAGVPAIVRESSAPGLAGLVKDGGPCSGCEAAHDVPWIAIVRESTREMRINWLHHPPPVSRVLLEHLDLGEAFTATLAIMAGGEPSNRYRDLVRVRDSAAAVGEAGDNGPAVAAMVAVTGRTTSDKAFQVAAGARLEMVRPGSGRAYPVYCQAFIAFKGDFLAATDRLFSLVPREAWERRGVDLRWSLRRGRDEPPFAQVQGRSLEAAWALLGASLYAKTSPDGLIHGVARTVLGEVSLSHVVISATCDEAGRLGPVNEQTIAEKQSAAAGSGAALFLVAPGQQGLRPDGVPTKPCESAIEAYRLVERLQAEHLLGWLGTGAARAHFFAWGCPEFTWVVLLLSVLAWGQTEGLAFLAVPLLAVLVWLLLWRRMLRAVAPRESLPLGNDSRRTPQAWLHMTHLVMARLEHTRSSPVARVGVLTALDWLASVFAALAPRSEREGPAGSFALADLGPRLPRVLGASLTRPDVGLLAGPLSTIGAILVLIVLSSPLQARVVELLPGGGTPRINGGWAEETDATGGVRRVALTPVFGETGFVVAAGQSGRMRVVAGDRARARRRLRLHCDNCSVWTVGGPSAATVVGLADGGAEFDYWMQGGRASLTVELVTEWGKPLASAVVQLDRR